MLELGSRQTSHLISPLFLCFGKGRPYQIKLDAAWRGFFQPIFGILFLQNQWIFTRHHNMSLHISTPTSPINKIYPSAQASWTPLENPPEILPFDGYLFYPFLTFRQEFWNLSKATRKDSHYRNQWLGPDFDIFWCFFCVFVFILMFFFVWFYLFECFFVCVFVFTLAVLIICWSCQANEQQGGGGLHQPVNSSCFFLRSTV